MQDQKLTRRDFIGQVTVAIPLTAAVLSREASAQAAQPHLDVNDPVAKALMYTHDATTVDKAKAPNYKPGQTCANCVQLQAGTGEWRGCTAFPGKLVNVKGWCSAWVEAKS